MMAKPDYCYQKKNQIKDIMLSYFTCYIAILLAIYLAIVFTVLTTLHSQMYNYPRIIKFK